MRDSQLNSIIMGRALASLRQEKGITQEVLSGLSNIGRTHLSAIERSERKPTLETLWRIASALDMRPSELIIRIENTIEEDSNTKAAR